MQRAQDCPAIFVLCVLVCTHLETNNEPVLHRVPTVRWLKLAAMITFDTSHLKSKSSPFPTFSRLCPSSKVTLVSPASAVKTVRDTEQITPLLGVVDVEERYAIYNQSRTSDPLGIAYDGWLDKGILARGSFVSQCSGHASINEMPAFTFIR